MGVLDYLTRMLSVTDETVDIIDGLALRLGHITTLPTCNEQRWGQIRWTKGEGGSGTQADEVFICLWDGAAYGWSSVISTPASAQSDLLWSVLTTGDSASPELIWDSDGDVIMTTEVDS